MSSEVSIVIPAYNAARFIERAIRSLLAQTARPREIIVVDDGSRDDTARVARDADPGIIVLRQPNRGPGAARNTGVARAAGELVGFLDADDEYQPEMVATLSDALAAFPGAEVASGAYLSESGGLFRRHPAENRLATGPRGVVLRDFFAEARRGPLVHTNAVMVRRRALLAVGGFREDIRFGEDVDLWCKLAGRFDWVFVDRPVSIYHHGGATSSTLQTPDRQWPTDILMTEAQMRQCVRPELWRSFREYRRDWLLGEARGSLQVSSETRRARELLERIAPAPVSLAWCATWLLAHLPPPLGKSVLKLNRRVRARGSSPAVGGSDATEAKPRTRGLLPDARRLRRVHDVDEGARTHVRHSGAGRSVRQ